MIQRKTGIFPNMSNDDYHQPIGLSNSGIRKILDCPARYHHEYLSGRIKKQTPAMLLGSVFHTMILEPKKFDSIYTVMPKIDRRTKQGKSDFAAIMAMAIGTTLVDEKTYHEACAMAHAMRESKYMKLFETGNAEHSIFWEMDGVLLKCKPDWYCTERKIIVDLKTTDSVSPIDFVYSIWKYGYHSQAALIIDGLQQESGITFDNYIILAIESEEPHLVQAFNLLPQTIARGRDEYYRGAYIYKECKEWNLWPAYGDSILDLDLPEYLLKKELP